MTAAIIQTVATADGPFTILANADGVLASGWTASAEQIVGRVPKAHRPLHIEPGECPAAAAVAAYYDGDVTCIDSVAVVQYGTTFQQAGWAALRKIDAGTPLTYTEFATELGNPNAVRAAASVCARNAAALFVPCHRVLRTDGSLGGFAWGVNVKASLLAREAN